MSAATETKGANPSAFVPDANKVAIAQAEHAACQAAGKNALEHARAAGQAIIDMDLKRGETEIAYKACGINKRTAQSYQQIARNWTKIKNANAESVSAALATIAVHKPSDQRPTVRPPTPAQRVFKGFHEVADALNFAVENVAKIGTEAQKNKLRDEIKATRKLLDNLERELSTSFKTGKTAA